MNANMATAKRQDRINKSRDFAADIRGALSDLWPPFVFIALLLLSVAWTAYLAW